LTQAQDLLRTVLNDTHCYDHYLAGLLHAVDHHYRNPLVIEATFDERLNLGS
jgi:hypothetical protein